MFKDRVVREELAKGIEEIKEQPENENRRQTGEGG